MENYVAGEPGKTNWPDLANLPQRKTQEFYAIDVEGETIATASTMPAARYAARLLHGRIRFVRLEEEHFVEEHQAATARKRFGDFRR